MGIGLKLSQLMEIRGTNANELAKKVGVAPTTIYSMIRRDSKKADIEVLIKIAHELGVSTEYFCDNEPDPQNYEPTYEDIQSLVARNGKKLTLEQKQKLIRTLLSEDD
ncbi:helix-turn-helix domain-containing protein [Ruminococcus gauvreauii]|uniref:helix-turn-helix domain-containing protein n=1 Tax=Ruminococcus gauvreauii TaxID=438033 RepID=UPI0039843791